MSASSWRHHPRLLKLKLVIFARWPRTTQRRRQLQHQCSQHQCLSQPLCLVLSLKKRRSTVAAPRSVQKKPLDLDKYLETPASTVMTRSESSVEPSNYCESI
mmetsp:Transcript_49420/g.106429  ORF Transcript_49420/g.106429 Transcript_49420/m.106429 type:complete len:102 (+) Transcript_49420:579-884(+)